MSGRNEVMSTNEAESSNVLLEDSRLFSPSVRRVGRFRSHYYTHSPCASVSTALNEKSTVESFSSPGRFEIDESASKTPSFSASGMYESESICLDKKTSNNMRIMETDPSGISDPLGSSHQSRGLEAYMAKGSKAHFESAEKKTDVEIMRAALKILDDEKSQVSFEIRLLREIERRHEFEQRKQEKNSRAVAKRDKGLEDESKCPVEISPSNLTETPSFASFAGQVFGPPMDESLANSTIRSSISSQSDTTEIDQMWNRADNTGKRSMGRSDANHRQDSLRILNGVHDVDSLDGRQLTRSATLSPQLGSTSATQPSPLKKESFWGSVFKPRQHKEDKARGQHDPLQYNQAENPGPVPTATPPRLLPNRAHPIDFNLKFKALIIGEQGSGKTSFKACFTSNILKTLPEVSPSMQSSSSTFYFKTHSAAKHRVLEVSVIDSGPLPLTSGVSTFCTDGAFFLMTLSLAGVKQKPAIKKMSPFGPKHAPEPILLERDKNSIRAHLRSIASLASNNSSFVFIGTFMDLLTDTSQLAIEAVISAIKSVIMEELSKGDYRIMFRGCFAVSSVDHKVVSEMRSTGPRLISDLWTMLCETMLKDAVSTSGGVKLLCPSPFNPSQQPFVRIESEMENGVEKLKSEIGNLGNSVLAKYVCESVRAHSDHQSDAFELLVHNSSLFTYKQLRKAMMFSPSNSSLSRIRNVTSVGNIVADKTPAHPCQSYSQAVFPKCSDADEALPMKPKTPLDMLRNLKTEHSPVSLLTTEEDASQLLILRSTSKALMLTRRIKNELNVILTSLRKFRCQLYAIGVQSKAHFDHILSHLKQDGQICSIRWQNNDELLLFQPHLISRAVFAVIKTAELSAYPTTDRRKLLPMVDPEEVQRADPEQNLSSKGILSDALIMAIGGCMSSVCSDRSKSSHLVHRLLISADFMVQCQEPAALSSGGGEHFDYPSHVQSNTDRIANYFNRQKNPKGDGMTSACSFAGVGNVFVVPSLVKKNIDSACLSVLSRLVEDSKSLNVKPKTNLKRSGLYAEELHCNLSPLPSFLRYKIICRLGKFIRKPEFVFSDGVWLSNTQLSSHCLIYFHEASSPYELSIYSVSGLSHLANSTFVSEILGVIRSLIVSDLRGIKLFVSSRASQPHVLSKSVKSDLALFSETSHTPVDDQLGAFERRFFC